MGWRVISRVYIKELLGFKEVDLEFSKGLVVVTGPSGAGKSVFIGSILASFGLANQEAKLCEVTVDKPKALDSAEFDLEDELTLKSIKKDRVRIFIDGQNISKKRLKELFSKYFSYISVRDKSGFESESLIALVDSYILDKDSSFSKLFASYKEEFLKYTDKKRLLESAKNRSKESLDRVEFLKFEVEKLKNLNIKVGEYEELLVVKKQLSKLDKISEVAQKAQEIFNYEDSIYELFSMLEKDSSYFSDAMNQLRGDLEDIESLSEELADIDIEEVLNRLEQIDDIVKRHGSEEEALEYLALKQKELEEFELLDGNLEELEAEVKTLESSCSKLAKDISKFRAKYVSDIEKELKRYLSELKLPEVKFIFEDAGLQESGKDSISIDMAGIKVEQLSGGEFNRVRLALLTVSANKSAEGIIILDEIDANVSGDESIAIADMISKLSKSFQIFAISHQPHLSSKAKEHILVTKDSNGSYAKALEGEDRIKEVARIVGGESYTQEAINFAKKLFKEAK